MKKILIGVAVVLCFFLILVTKPFWVSNCSGDVCGGSPDVRMVPLMRNQILCTIVGGRFRSDYNGWGGYSKKCFVASEWRCKLAGGFYVNGAEGATCYKSDPAKYFPFQLR